MTQSSKGPLSGIVVVDLSRILAGPYCTLLMAEMGARVIKVEPPKGGDDARAYGPFVKGKSTYFASVNRGKESIALDLKNDEQRTIFEKLLEKADVIVENFRPGTMEKLGYGWDTLHKKYPKLIYASASGLRPYRPQLQGSRLRHGRAGHGRRHEHHRQRGPATGARRHVDRRYRRGPVHRGRGQCSTGPSPQDRRGDQGRYRHVRLPDRAPGKRRHALHGRGRDPRPPGRAPSHHHALPGFPHRRRRHHHRRRQRRPLHQDLRGARPFRHGERSRLQDQCAPPEASRQARARDRVRY